MLNHPVTLSLLGLFAGILMGLTSFTGAILVPAFVLIFGFMQAKAQGTAVALTLSPLQLPALWNYHRAGNIDWRFMWLMTPGVIVGTFIGSHIANVVPPVVLKTLFGLLLVYVGAYSLLAITTANVVKAVVLSVCVAAFAGVMFGFARWTEAKPVADAPTANSRG